ncbi:MAG: LamG domain-containing protein, partial [Kiritimatiellae bacterium]|nr:LamG domain-containing protein [Kiritimatiellia bacterium]
MPNADPDQDDIPNWEEAISPDQPTPANHNTDPSPLWMTDMSYDRSFVNLYYNWGSAANFWTIENEQYPEYEHYPYPDNMYPGMMDPRPHYVFDFECNEGFDTDNDNLSDPYEINGSAGGVTDSQNPDRPIGRKALYLDGNAAARTRSVCAFGPNALRSFTLEVWVMPEEPASGKMQVILERPVTWNESNTSPTYEQIRRNFRLGLLGDGRPFVEFDNGSKNLVTERAIAPEGSSLDAGRWHHLAATMDGFSGKLALFKDGRRIASKSTTSIPYTGFTTTALNAVGSDEYHQPRWSPVVIGASDANPVGQVDGSYEFYNGAIYGVGGGQPQLGDFFKGWVDEVHIWDGARPGGEDAGDQRVAFWRWPTIKEDYDNLKRYGMDEVRAARNDVVKYLNRIVDYRKSRVDASNAAATAALNGSNPASATDTNAVASADVNWFFDARGMTYDEFIQNAVSYILMTGGEDEKCRIPPSLVCVYNFDTLPDPDYEPVQPAKFASLNGRPMDYNGVPWLRGATDRTTVYTSTEAPYLFPQYIQNLVSWQPLGRLVAVGVDEEYTQNREDANKPLIAYQPDRVVNSKYW